MKRISVPSIGFLDARYVNVTGDTMTGALVITPTADGVSILDINQADGTPVFDVDTTNRRIIVSSGASGQSIISSGLVVNNDAGNATQDDFTVKSNVLTAIFVDASADTMEIGIPTTFTRNILIDPNSDSTTFFQITQADDTIIFNVDTTNARVGVGTDSPNSAFHIKAGTPGMVGSHYAGQLIIQSPIDSVITGNAVITGYESDGSGNPDQQLWYLGSSSSSNSDIIFLNRRNSKLALGTYDSTRMTILGDGNVGIATTSPDTKLQVVGDTKLGDDNTNYLSVSSTGVVTLTGSAKRWLAVRPDLDYTVITAQGKPTQVVVGVFHGYSMPVYIAAQNEELFFNIHVPGRWDAASNPVVHLLVALAGAEDVSDNFKFQVSWEHLTEGDVIPATSHDVEVEQAVLTDRNAQYSTYELQFTIDYDVDTPDNLADHDDLAFRLRRIDATNPDVTNEIIILDYHIEFQVDKMFDGDAV